MKKIYTLRFFTKLFFLLFATAGFVNAQTIIYVSTGGTGDGSSWATASSGIQEAINASDAGTQIWIKAGTYYVPGDTLFTLKEGVSLYGGFAGTEVDPIQRSDFGLGGANETVLSGDIDKNGINDAGNAERVMYGEEISSETSLNGLTIRDGYADESGADGGGLRLNGGAPNIDNCTFAFNYCDDNAAGLYMYNAVLSKVTNCFFTGNFADDKAGAAYTATGCDAVFTNCVFDNNSADTDAGAFRAFVSAPTLINCTFTYNLLTSGDGSAIDANGAANITLINCVFWGNVEAGVLDEDVALTTGATGTFTNCAFQGTFTATGATATGTVDISTANPLFVNTAGSAGYLGYVAASDWAIQSGSPLKNTGLASGAPSMDITNAFRDATPDIGAYENAGVIPYTIATEVIGMGAITPDGAYVVPGANQIMVITPNPGYELTAASYNGSNILTSLVNNGDGSFNYTVSAIAANGVISATFEALAVEYTLSVSAGSNGTISPVGDMNVNVTDETVFTITPNANYVIHEILLNDVSVADELVDNGNGTFSYTLTGVGENSTLVVSFTELFTVTVTIGANGSVDPVGPIDMTAFDTTVFTITPKGGYTLNTITLSSVDVKGTVVDNGDGTYTYSLKELNADAVLAVTFSEFVGKISYVKVGGTGNGSSWANASGNLQDIILASEFGDQVWVAKGKYLVPGAVVDSSFTLKNGVSLYGGFAGTETSKNQRKDFRKGEVNETRLTADIDGNGFLTGGNAERVVFGEFISAATTIDGFTINGGKSDILDSNGAGMKLRASSPNINNCTFFDNYCDDGAHLYLYRSDDVASNPTVTNCFFIKGFANDDGGALYAASGTKAKFINCVFANNLANDEGGAVRNFEASPEFINCTFVYNALPAVDPTGGGTYGPAIRNYQGASPYMNCEPKFVNSVFWRNQKGDVDHNYDMSNTGAMATANVFVTVINCAFMDSLSSSCVLIDTLDIGPEDGSIVNPGFVNIAGTPGYMGYNLASDWNILSTSVLIGEGTNLEVGVPVKDIRGGNRDASVDIGAYEYDPIFSVKQLSAENFGLMLYPNPSNGEFTVKVKEGSLAEISVMDMTGRLIYQNNSLNYAPEFVINLRGQSYGVYFIRVMNSVGELSTQKLIIK
ncbi:MAG: T9SS type A sorting domain-containing protein [Bacteroidales bacterium]|nr:T9SS type A sorting domain-containing protein [Bacteroidales bacterium]MCF8391909.1 T9SS type A sorting domain-containing protein [Bacteroidales bacterium]